MVYETYGLARTPEAKIMAAAVKDATDDVRQQFNAQGGSIPEMKGPWLPQEHDPAAVLNAGFKGWFDYIKPKLDLNRMLDPLSNLPLTGATAQRLEDLLKSAWDHIVTGGWSDRKPAARAFGEGALYSQRQEHRFLHFNTADDWLAYNRDFGGGDPISAVFKHIRSMTNDIAAMEILGPNPASMIEWMKQVVQSETGKFVAGKPSLYSPSKLSSYTGTAITSAQDYINHLPNKLQAFYDGVMGGPVSSAFWGNLAGDVRNVLGAAQLGAVTPLAAMQDPMTSIAARHLSGIPIGRAITAIAHSFSKDTREVAARAGLITDEWKNVLANEARYSGILGGHDWSRWLIERTVNFSGLEPETHASKSVFGLDFMAAVADRVGKSFTELGNEMPAFRRTLEDYGITEKDWDAIRATPLHTPAAGSAPLLRPVDMADSRLGERYLEMILQQTERAVPTNTIRSKAMLTMGTQRGTLGGELMRSILQYKAFSLSFMSLQRQAVMSIVRSQGALAGAGYAGSLAIGLTLAGAASLQFKNLTNGKDVQDPDIKFWIDAIHTGGGMGLMGDFLFSDQNRFGQSPLESFLGPTYGLGKDITETFISNPARFIRGDKSRFGRDIVSLGFGRYVPALPSLWYTRLAYRRLFIDQLQKLVDPDAHQHFRQQEQRLYRETGQDYFWRPGETSPERAPTMAEQQMTHR